VYKAVHREHGGEILALHPAWRERQDELRRMCLAEDVVCSGCRQVVNLRAGERKRPHFAHCHLIGCDLASESPYRLEARALLYEWLITQAAGNVEIEVTLPGAPRAADAVVTLVSGKVVFWVIDRLLKFETRAELKNVFAVNNLKVIWILSANLLRPDSNQAAWILLSPCERDCLRQTTYDEIGRENRLLADQLGSSLHYLDITAETLIIYRSLERYHAPNVYGGRREVWPLAQIAIDPAGDLYCPGEEREALISRGARVKQMERVHEWLAPKQKAAAVRQPGLAEAAENPPMSQKSLPRSRGALGREWVVCIFCGERTQDWWAVWSEDGERLGKCRPCLEKGLG
jgi:hypothetical protein